MSNKVISWVWEESKIKKQSHLLALLSLADYANDEGTQYFTNRLIETTAKRSRMSEKQVNQIINELVKQRFFEIDEAGGDHVFIVWRAYRYDMGLQS